MKVKEFLEQIDKTNEDFDLVFEDLNGDCHDVDEVEFDYEHKAVVVK